MHTLLSRWRRNTSTFLGFHSVEPSLLHILIQIVYSLTKCLLYEYKAASIIISVTKVIR